MTLRHTVGRLAATVAIAILYATATTPTTSADTIADCRQSRDQHLRLSACTRVIEDRAASEADKATAFRLRGNARADAGALDEAIADLTSAIKLAPADSQSLIRRALVYIEKGNADAAINDYSAAIAARPRSAIAYNGRGHARLVKGDSGGAIQDFTKAIEISPNSSSAYNNRGLAHRKAGNLDMAINDYTSAIAINPIYALAYNNRGYAFEADGRKTEAAADFRRALLLDPSLTGAKDALIRLDAAGTLVAESAVLVQQGRKLAETHCARCHAIDKQLRSPNPRAPTFRGLHAQHPAMALREPLTRGIFAPHDEMPKFSLSNTEIDEIVAYINSLSNSR